MGGQLGYAIIKAVLIIHIKPQGRVRLGVQVDQQRLLRVDPSVEAKLIAVVVLPHPPFWFAIEMIFIKHFSSV